MNTDVQAPVGFYDSGIGGVTVLNETLNVLPRENYVYLADCSHAPYGDKPRAQILDRARFCVGALVRCGVKAVVLACNTATAVAAETLRAEFGGIIIGAEPAVKPACAAAKGKVMVLVTPLTAKEPRLHRLIARTGRDVIVAPLGGLASSVEKHIDNVERLRPEIYRMLSEYPDDVSAVVLGCTHYVHVRDIIADYYAGRAAVFDGNRGIALHLQAELSDRSLLNTAGGHVRYISF